MHEPQSPGRKAQNIQEELPFEPGSGDVLGGQEHKAQNFGMEDDSTIAQQLIREGLDEALTDEMLEARKSHL
jgi:hypothetical protein